MKAADLIRMIKPARPRVLWSTSPVYRELMHSGHWISEPKHDGYRCLVGRGDDGTLAMSRHGKRLPVQGDCTPDLPPGTVVDGEWMRGTGELVLFDVPVVGGARNAAPLATRRAQLLELVPRLGPVRAIVRWQGGALEVAKDRGMEGIVLKDVNSKYPEGDTTSWLKVKG